MRQDIRDIIKTLCQYKQVELIAGAVCTDPIHISVSIPPKLGVTEFMGYIKGKSALKIYDKASRSFVLHAHISQLLHN